MNSSALAADVVARGWGLAHPLGVIRLARGMVLVYGPRDAAVEPSHQYATGLLN